ncbi:MAG: right-handed parallel beta-helix repeat-containing protein [Rhodanobacteraceae bacterium]
MNHPDSHFAQAAVGRAAVRCVFALSILLSASSACGTTFTVSNTADTGNGSLRQAITDANGNGGLDTIEFNIDAASDSGCAGTPRICTIQPVTNLPAITDPVSIDGYTQPGSSMNTQAVGDDAVILIELDATHASLGLNLNGSGASGSSVRGLAVTHVTGYGVKASHVDDLTITGNFVGTDATGTSTTSPSGQGIFIDTASGTVVGGTDPSERNLVAAGTNGIYLELLTGCTVQGNYVAVDKSGEAPLPTFNAIVLSQTGNCLVGGSAMGAGNVIGDCGNVCIHLQSGSNNVIQGNLIGTDATGTMSMGGGAYGIVESGSADRIGGSGAGEGNVISGNGRDGVLVAFFNIPVSALIQGNRIGTDPTGTLAIRNAWCGIEVATSTANSIDGIGGTDPGAGNLISFNGTNGISVSGATSTGWPIFGNSIYANGNMGITLNARCDNGAATPIANDDGDADSGANNRQNYPVITAVTISPMTMVHVSGTLNSTADSMFHVEFFANANCGPARANGQGKIYLGSTDVMTSGNDASFGPLDFDVPVDRHVVTATTTDVDGNTSEFSECATEDPIFSDGLDGN